MRFWAILSLAAAILFFGVRVGSHGKNSRQDDNKNVPLWKKSGADSKEEDQRLLARLPASQRAVAQAVRKWGGNFWWKRKIVGSRNGQLNAHDDNGNAQPCLLETLPIITWVLLDNTMVADAQLKELRELKQLEGLSLNGCSKVTETGLKELRGIRKLQNLNLNRTPLSDAGLKEIQRLVTLRSLSIAETKVTDAGIAQLQEALPTLELKR